MYVVVLETLANGLGYLLVLSRWCNSNIALRIKLDAPLLMVKVVGILKESSTKALQKRKR